MSYLACAEIIHHSLARLASVVRLRSTSETLAASVAAGQPGSSLNELQRRLRWTMPSLRLNGVVTLPNAFWNSFVLIISTSWVSTWVRAGKAGSQEADSESIEEKSENDGSEKEKETPSRPPEPPSYIQKLLQNPGLYDPIRAPRNPIVLCHGLYGFDVWGPSAFQRHYWLEILDILRKKVGADVIVTSVPPTGSVQDRAKILDALLREKAKDKSVNFMAHSMGGLDCRQLITHIRPTEYTPLSLTTVATPHRGSPFMDWCNVNIGIGSVREAVNSSRRMNVPYSLKSPILAARTVSATASAAASAASSSSSNSSSSSSSTFSPMANYLGSLPQSITAMILSLVDSPAYSNLTTTYLNDHFNPATPNVDGVKYFSVAGRVDDMSIFHPLWLPKLIIDKAEEVEREAAASSSSSLLSTQPKHDEWPSSLVGRFPDPQYQQMGNDGLVTVESAKWGEFLGVVDGCDHWDIRGNGGFSDVWETAGEAGGLGWVRGVDWSKWGIRMGWFGRGGGGSDPKPTKAQQDKDDLTSATMAWIGDSMSRASDKQEAAELLRIGPPPQTQMIAPPSSSSSKAAKKAVEDGKKFNLERLYIALSRKLYDEGL